MTESFAIGVPDLEPEERPAEWGRYLLHLLAAVVGFVATCPAAGRVTYRDYVCTQSPDNFSFSCVGNNHAKTYTGYSTSSNNLPQYSAESGLLDHP